MNVLELDRVGRTYPPGITALRDASFSVREGEALVIVGPSGSGKSTLLHVMGALDRPSTGTVRLGGKDIAVLSDNELSRLRGRSIGFVFQQAHLLEQLTAQQNVELGLRYAGVARAERAAAARTALARVHMTHRHDHRPAALSGGERQRVGIARAIAASPSLLLADEPTGALDRATSDEVLALFGSLHDDGVTLAVITHDAHVADRFARRIEIRDGHLSESAR